MKLSNDNKKYLKNINVPEEDFTQIEECIPYTTFKLYKPIKGKYDEFVRNISRKEAIEILGIKEFLSGMSRSAFHLTAVRFSLDENYTVYFDSSKYFKE